MIAQLEKLSAVYDARLQAARHALAGPSRALAEIDAELARIDATLAELHAQRASWEQQWQQWLSHDGILRRGEEYNRFHVRLAALEEDVSGQRAEVEERRAAVQQQVDAARKALWKCQQRVEQVAGVLAQAGRARRAHAETVQARGAEDHALARAAS